MLAESPSRNTYVHARGGGSDERWQMWRHAGAMFVMIVCVQLVAVVVVYVPVGCRPETVLNY
jgi:heme/copper-type cytochrome/quinol oxidase subunit 2